MILHYQGNYQLLEVNQNRSPWVTSCLEFHSWYMMDFNKVTYV